MNSTTNTTTVTGYDPNAFFYPPGRGTCVNDTQCSRGGRCAVTTGWCLCPRLYNPLDNCQSYYYDTAGVLHPALLLAVTVAVNVILFGLVFRSWWEQTKRFIQKPRGIPKPMLVSVWMVVICNIGSILSVVVNLLKLAVPQLILGGITPSLFLHCHIAILYCWFVLTLRHLKFGQLHQRWRMASIVLAVTGIGGLQISFWAGTARSILDLPNASVSMMVSVGLVIGLVVPALISIPIFVKTLRFLDAKTRNTRSSMQTLWKCTWLLIGATLYLIFVLLVLMGYNYIVASDLFGSITVRRWLDQLLFFPGLGIFVAFICTAYLPPNGKRRRSVSALVDTTTSTDASSTKSAVKASQTTTTTLEISENITSVPSVFATSKESPSGGQVTVHTSEISNESVSQADSETLSSSTPEGTNIPPP